jgi:hypothetical protein
MGSAFTAIFVTIKREAGQVEPKYAGGLLLDTQKVIHKQTTAEKISRSQL